VTRGELENAVRLLINRTREPGDKCLADRGNARIDHHQLIPRGAPDIACTRIDAAAMARTTH
jgi:hypothetical protein